MSKRHQDPNRQPGRPRVFRGNKILDGRRETRKLRGELARERQGERKGRSLGLVRNRTLRRNKRTAIGTMRDYWKYRKEVGYRHPGLVRAAKNALRRRRRDRFQSF